MDCNPPGSSVHGIFQVKIQEWVTITSFRVSSQPRDPTCDGLLLNSWGWAQPEKLCRWGFPTEFGGRVPGYGIVALAVSEGETHSPSGLRKQNIEQRGCS